MTERSLRTWFDKELITAGGIRSIVLRSEGDGHTGSLPNAAVDALGKRFLLRTELRGGGAWVELVHDRFVEPIRASNEVWFAEHLSTLQRAAALWQDSGRAAGMLLAGEALDGAVAWAGTHMLLPYEQEFLDASRAARTAAEKERRQTQRIRLLAVVAGVVAVAAIVLAFFAWTSTQQAQVEKQRADEQAALAATREAEAIVAKATAEASAVEAERQKQDAQVQKVEAERQKQIAQEQTKLANQKATEAEQEKQRAEAQARRAQAGELAVHAQTTLATNTDSSGSLPLILASDAVLTTWAIDHVVTVNADAALRDAIDAAPPYAMTLPRHRHTGSVWSAAYSPDGTQIVTASDDRTARIWDTATGQEVRQLSGHTDSVRSAAYSPDGAQIVTASDDGTARIWDAATGQEVRQLSGHTAWVNSAAYSPDGAQIVTASADGTARIWDAATGQELRQLSGHTASVLVGGLQSRRCADRHRQ